MTLCLPEIQMLPTLPDNSWLNGQTDAQNKSREATLFSHERWFSRWRRTLNATRATPFLGYYWIRFKNQNRERCRYFPQARDWLNAKPEVFCCKFPSTSKLAPQVQAPGPISHILAFNNTTQHTPYLWKKRDPDMISRQPCCVPIQSNMLCKKRNPQKVELKTWQGFCGPNNIC